MMLLQGRVGSMGFQPIAKARAMACGSNPRALSDSWVQASCREPNSRTMLPCFISC